MRSSYWTWWIILVGSAHHLWAGFFVLGQFGQAISPSSEVPSECFCWHLYQPPHTMLLQPQLACVTLKRQRAARGERAPRVPSIVDGFSRLPWLVYAGGTVAPDVCHRVLVAA
jgi:hypothetical protein